MSSEDAFTPFLIANRQWQQDTSAAYPDLFPALAKGQAPPILWIGCSDSRVPETTLCGAKPGDIFVHRNIANVLTPHDISSQSVIYYAVEHLKVKDIVVCGHKSCGGVAAALGNSKVGGVMDSWLTPLRELRAGMKAEMEGKSAQEQGLMLVEANVRKGVNVLRANPEVIAAMEERGLKVHGCVYDVGSGELRELDIQEGEESKQLRLEAFMAK